MLVRKNSSNTPKPVPALPSEVANQDAFWSEFKYRRGSEIFGEAEPAHYVYRIREGAGRTHKLLSDGRRQIGAFHLPGDIFGVENGEVHRFTAEAILDTAVWIAKRRSFLAGLAQGDIPTAKNVPHGHSGQAYRAGVTLAEWICRAADRVDPPRVPGSYHRIRRGPPAPTPAIVRALLQ